MSQWKKLTALVVATMAMVIHPSQGSSLRRFISHRSIRAWVEVGERCEEHCCDDGDAEERCGVLHGGRGQKAAPDLVGGRVIAWCPRRTGRDVGVWPE